MQCYPSACKVYDTIVNASRWDYWGHRLRLPETSLIQSSVIPMLQERPAASASTA
ncbi:MAG: hypothetical protein OXU36_17945 [Candidatus Poribacteria bacterium]|nr:hypothetical protein [Candidatus Poribacteria bacterium]